jgi:hypothetical protein
MYNVFPVIPFNIAYTHLIPPPIIYNKNLWFIPKLVDQIFNESLPRARKERQIAPQASAGYPLSINPLLAFRKAQRGREKKASKK